MKSTDGKEKVQAAGIHKISAAVKPEYICNIPVDAY